MKQRVKRFGMQIDGAIRYHRSVVSLPSWLSLSLRTCSVSFAFYLWLLSLQLPRCHLWLQTRACLRGSTSDRGSPWWRQNTNSRGLLQAPITTPPKSSNRNGTRKQLSTTICEKSARSSSPQATPNTRAKRASFAFASRLSTPRLWLTRSTKWPLMRTTNWAYKSARGKSEWPECSFRTMARSYRKRPFGF